MRYICPRRNRGRQGRTVFIDEANSGRLGIVVLAAGKGARMNSARPKVMHEVAGRPMLAHALAAAEALAPARVTVVAGPGMAEAEALAAPHGCVVQQARRGTADAVECARARHECLGGDVLVLYGDTPLIAPATLQRALERRRADDDPAVVALGFRADDPADYGRLRVDADGGLAEIVEAADADAESAAIRLCNSGIMVFDGAALWALIRRVGADNAKGERYLTDIAALARAEGRACAVVEASARELMGVNTRAGLAAVERAAQEALRARAMENGVTLLQPESVHFSFDTALGRDVTVEPNVFFGPGVEVAEGAAIRAFSHLEGARVGRGATVGPFARLRPGAALGEGARVGNFVEVKAAELAAGAKANHLAYIGDARVGRGANIGAGTITCNYDGFRKHRTEIGDGAFVGSNAALVAPVSVGDGAIIGAGSVVSRDVPADALAVTRAPQRAVAGGAARFRGARSG